MYRFFEKVFHAIIVVGGTVAFFVVVVSFGTTSSLEVSPQTALISGSLPEEHVNATQENDAEEVSRMAFVGDIMLSRNISEIIDANNDYEYPFRYVKEYLTTADLVFGNLESPVSGRGRDQGSIYSFNADPYTVSGLVSSGFDVVSIANNHIFDHGPQAMLDTISVLKISGIDPIGGAADYQTAHKPLIRTVGDAKVAFLAYTNLIPRIYGGEQARPAVAYLDRDAMKKDIMLANVMADIVVVSFHWGEEYETKHNAWQEEVAREAINAGASLIVGHHPHVVQEVEQYGDGFIAYSLGNFIFDQNFSPDTGRGLVLEAIVANKKIREVKTRGVSFTKTFQPVFNNE